MWRNSAPAIVLLLLLVGAASAQRPSFKAAAAGQGTTGEITPALNARIRAASPGEELPVIIFYKKRNKTTGSALQAMASSAAAVTARGGKIKHQYSVVPGLSATMPASRIAELSGDPGIERIYYDEVVTLPPEPGEQNLTVKMDVSTVAIGADYAWNTLGYTGTGVKVAIVDTGVDYTHADFGSCGSVGSGCRVADGYDFVNNDNDPADDNGHGTHVAGTVGANGTIKGVAPNATLFAVKVLDSSGSGTESDIIAGMDWAVANGADIISMSIGGHDYPYANDEFASATTIVADAAVERGVVVVIAAGNEGPGTGTINYLATGLDVITVGASDDKGTPAISDDIITSFSNRGPSAFGRLDPDLVAPGKFINSTSMSGGYEIMSGTSMATPHVAGAAALLLEENSSLTPAEVRKMLMHTAGNLTATDIHVFEEGAGIINVTRALTQNISATIDGNDRWETSVIPGFNDSALLALRNNNAYPVNFTFAIESITDLEGDHSLPSSAFNIPTNVTIPALTTSNIKVGFRAPPGSDPAVYGTTLVVSNDTAGTLRIPIVVTIPLTEGPTISGTVDADCTGCFSSITAYGDWIYYKLQTHNGTSLYASLNWTVGGNDLDFYLYAPNGVTVDVSEAASGTSEEVNLTNMVYDEYWLAVHAYSLVGTASYTITVKYPTGPQSNLQVSPSSWQGIVGNGQTKNVTFTITNDATAKTNLNVSVNILSTGPSDADSGTLISSGSPDSYWFVWNVTSSGLDTTYSRYMNVTLSWNKSSNNMNLYLIYYNGSAYFFSRFGSTHNNTELGIAEEKIEMADVRHYLKNYPDLIVGISNPGAPQAYNLTINFTDISPWGAASVNDTPISLSSGETRQINVSIDGSSLDPGQYDAIFTIRNSTEDFATIPLSVLAVNLFDSKDLTPPSDNGFWGIGETVLINGSGWRGLQQILINITDVSGSSRYDYLKTATVSGSFTEEPTYTLGSTDDIGVWSIYLSFDNGTTWEPYDTFTVEPAAPEFPLGSTFAFLSAVVIYLEMRRRADI